jgi:ABC-type transport system substrate-binding protein
LFSAANFAFLDSLFVHSDTGSLVPQIAAAAPSLRNGGIRDRGKTVVVQLKRGLRWANGAEITSADVRFFWQVALDPAFGSCEWCDLVSRIDTPDRYTAVFRLKQTGYLLLYRLEAGQLAFPPIEPLPAVWPGKWNHDPHLAALKLNQDPSWTWIGSGYPTDGPYYIASATATEMVLRPMKYYSTMSCGAYLSRIIVRSYPTYAALLAGAASRQVDLITYLALPNISLLPELQRHRDAYITHLDPGLALENMQFNENATYQGRPNPVHDARVRLALALALDKLRLTQRALPLNRREASRLLVWSPWINTPKLVVRYADRSITGQWDPLANGGEGGYVSQTGTGSALADARKLLSETPWKHGFSLDFDTTNTTTRQVEGTEVAADWARIGVQVNPHFVSPFQLFSSYAAGGILAHGLYQAADFAQNWVTNDPTYLALNLGSRYIPSDTNPVAGYGNYSRIRDKLIDQALAQAATTIDDKVLSKSYAAVQRELNQKAHGIMLYVPPAVWTDDRRVQGLKGSAEGLALTPWTWKLKGR